MSAQQDLYGAIQRLFSFSLQATRDDSTTVDTEKAKEDAKVKPRDDKFELVLSGKKFLDIL